MTDTSAPKAPTRLPVVGSTAASTAFCSATIVGPGFGPRPGYDGQAELRLHFDGNGKVTAGNGTLADPKPNALSLVQVETCPQSTPTCRSLCYVHNLEAAQKAIHDLYVENTVTLREIGLGSLVVSAVSRAERELQEQWAMLVAKWIRENAAGGFRWHVSGDVMSIVHAAWIRDVSLEAGPVRSWIYTRSFESLGPLVEAHTGLGGPLAINLSCDRDNLDDALRVRRAYRRSKGVDLRLCYLAADDADTPDLGYLTADDVIFPNYELRPRQFASLAESPWWQSISQFERGLVCPVDAHNKAENRRCGPCSRCLT